MNNSVENEKLTSIERLKIETPTLAGTIAQTLYDPAIDRFPDSDKHILKFHGVFQQDDRDLRKKGKKYIFMVRCRVPSGVLTPETYLVYDELSEKYANNTLRITARQNLQFHGVIKSALKPLMKALNDAKISTLGTGGDLVRVMAPSMLDINHAGAEIKAHVLRVSVALLPQTPAYQAIWKNGVQLDAVEDRSFSDPFFGQTYLPRNFKIAFAVPPLNDVDVFTNDLGFIAAIENGQLAGYNIVAGGGMGHNHGNEKTFSRLADEIGFIMPENVIDVARAAVAIHRDFSDRSNRKHARLKYLLAERGATWFREELERQLGFRLEEAKPLKFERQGDLFGWHQQADGRLFLGLFVENGRIRDTNRVQLKTALRQVVQKYEPEMRFTPASNLILANIVPSKQEKMTKLFVKHGIAIDQQGTALRRAAIACVALPTCDMAIAEAERYLPDLIARIDGLLSEVGLADQEIIIRMTGCPNGCTRPYMAEIGLVGRGPGKEHMYGKGPGRYHIYLGGNEASTRLNRLYRENVNDSDILGELRPLLLKYAKSRAGKERFGDWCYRTLWPEQI
ncbi:MAG: NADPH-dependent assimilatory sulfite reductase hemoprotein subunit [Desulfobulbaceae bacterium]|nr:NADPH-dependent assimilatory sulfite reductase hemoprotein subunit [Desulfobulbaceae bacterium]